ncbi:glutamine-hydrolyzing carbamoyl-phosphate synthase small subunit [Anthocerotibacter panamensis]|uniref:glutamine-hydrolyzing carbamoyl-phosphate synthase small subunit n=1 Tax=Anthocerotibacter panamensis TaxID=2857077 RepID=UPI001C406677|nr:glutamine-hydrolyzing carbamoyl-phosphate synthase small subunit [Anthocerotibacter panamensis]
MVPALLVLADGTTFEGYSCGHPGTALGELVFNTGMTGYQEVITDPSYCGQIVTFTYPELGNTGINPEDTESLRPWVQGVVCRNFCEYPSNWRASASLRDFFLEWQVVAISGVDTRALTRHIRDHGAQNGIISTEILDPEALLRQVRQAPDMNGLDLVPRVTTAQPYEWTLPTAAIWEFGTVARSHPRLRVVALDFGIKHNILRRLVAHGCQVLVVPGTATAQEILAYEPDGIFLSNGPGDPAAVHYGIATTRALLDCGKPIFGICLGHQILGLALGGQTYKMKFGHRGLNQPAYLQSEKSTQVEITSQNHGFAIAGDSLPTNRLQISHHNLNDNTIEGLRHLDLPVFSVQYHPEASPGPHDADYLFEEFVCLMERQRQLF